jgi:tRNA1Val (adenine37-N6)-methyltransferase
LDYSQPYFFKFGEDSLFLSKKFIETEFYKIQTMGSEIYLCDLCCGSGVIGLEILNKINNMKLTSIDILEDYLIHYEKNVSLLYLQNFSPQFLHRPISKIKTEIHKEKFDFIVSNPPYYDPSKGRLPNDEKRRIAKFFVKDSFEIFISSVNHCLKEDGAFWFLKTTKESSNALSRGGLTQYFKRTDCFVQNEYELSRFVKLNKN